MSIYLDLSQHNRILFRRQHNQLPKMVVVMVLFQVLKLIPHKAFNLTNFQTILLLLFVLKMVLYYTITLRLQGRVKINTRRLER